MLIPTLDLLGQVRKVWEDIRGVLSTPKKGWNDLISNRTYSSIAFSKQELIKMV
jgi:hypothetical protein